MVEFLINNPGLWDQIYQGYTFHALDDLGFSGTESSRVEIREHPRVLRDLKTVVEDFWGKYTEENPGAWNDPKYMVRGLSDVTKDNSTIVIRPFLVDYALIVFASPRRGTEYEHFLTGDQKAFLNSLKELGMDAYARGAKGYLFGDKVGGLTAKLRELVPMGMVDVSSPEENDVFTKTLRRELQEETTLDLDRDVADVRLTHFIVNSFYGEFDVLYRLTLNPSSEDRMRTSSEHTMLQFMSEEEIRSTPLHLINPCSAAILKQLGILY